MSATPLPPAPPSPLAAALRGRSVGGLAGANLGLLAALLAMILLFGLLSDYFLTLQTFRTIANQIPDLAILAVGMTFVLVIGGIDLSVGSVLALSGAVLSVALTQWQWSLPAAFSLSLLTGAACGLLTGTVTVAWRAPSFIVSLGMLEVARGGAYLVTDSRTQYIGGEIGRIGTPLIAGLSPAFIAAIFITVLGQIVLTRSVFGRHAVGIGANEEAMRLAGIRTWPVKIAVFTLTGALAALAALCQVSRLEAADPNAGIGFELQVIAAVVIGGTSLMGGRGSVVSTFAGVLIVSVLAAGLAQLGVSDPMKRIVTGLVIVIAVILDVYRGRKLAAGE